MLRLIAFLLIFPAALLAQGAPKTILVLDGSGSMWGQVDGVNKIVIAREVIEELLTTLPPEQELGLMSYGHRRKGDCADIELLIAPGTDRAAVLDAVNAINPRGMTPLSDAVIAAAEALRYTEEAATVILVSDGIETCDRDPCVVGRALEAAGVGFTAHVVGFDVAGEPEALAQLQCLAEETGGMFRTAANAEELARALDVVVRTPDPAPDPARVTFQALDGAQGRVIRDGLVWFVETDAAGVVLDNDASAPEPVVSLLPGEGRAEVLRLADEAVAEARFTVGATPLTVTLVLPEFRPPARVSPPAEAPAGATIPVAWTGPDAPDDYISVAEAGAPEGSRTSKVFTERGNPAILRLPMMPGDYEIRYVLREGLQVLAMQPITLTEVTAALDAPASLPAGSEISVGWDGPDYDRDFIAIARPDAPDTGFEVRAYTGNGNPARFRAPATPGDYELRYVGNDNGTRVLARQPLTLTE